MDLYFLLCCRLMCIIPISSPSSLPPPPLPLLPSPSSPLLPSHHLPSPSFPPPPTLPLFPSPLLPSHFLPSPSFRPPIQITILEKALNLHKQRIDASLQGLHSKLETCFDEIQGMVFPERRKMVGQSHSHSNMGVVVSTL